ADAGADAAAGGHAPGAAAAVLADAARPARRAACRGARDPRAGRGAPGALVAGRGPGRPLLSRLRPGGGLRTARARGPGLGRGAFAHQDLLPVAAHLEQIHRVDQGTEAAVAVVARVERPLVAQVAANPAQVGPALGVRHGPPRAPEPGHPRLARLACARGPGPGPRHLEQIHRVDQGTEAAVAVVARVERPLVAQVAANPAQVGPALVVGNGRHRAAQLVHQRLVVLEFARGPGPGLLGRHAAVVPQLLQEQEGRTGLHEWQRRLLLAEAVDRVTVVAQAHHQRGEVGVAGDDGEAVEGARVHQVH